MNNTNDKSMKRLQELIRSINWPSETEEEKNNTRLITLKCDISKHPDYNFFKHTNRRNTIEYSIRKDRYTLLDVLEEKTDVELVYKLLLTYQNLHSITVIIPIDVINIITRFFIFIGKLAAHLFDNFNKSSIYCNNYFEVIDMLTGDNSIHNLQSTRACKIPSRNKNADINEQSNRELSY